ncbi:MAG TPA: hypothetical protein VFP10_12430 [Candidatus Eisenbacteria bacterium]|nr:hypothetical protein [Candidatus Eisenbacteria bacterium]
MEDIHLLVDYKGYFETKYHAEPYRSGLDRSRLEAHFADYGVRARFINFCDVNPSDPAHRGRVFLYTSTEDYGLHYRSFVQDIVLGLEAGGAKVIPPYEFLHAHHNKVYMEILRERLLGDEAGTLKSHFFGTLEELEERVHTIALPVVVKPASGARSVGVRLCRTRAELLKAAADTSASQAWAAADARDLARSIRRKGYKRESLHRRKFVVQAFMPELDHDWKILVYGRKYYVLRRSIRTHDFRASGSGRFEFPAELPAGLLDYAARVFERLNVPHISLDIGAHGSNFNLFEFQAVYFGTLTLERSPFHFVASGGTWKRVDGPSELEEEFARGVMQYLGVSTKMVESGVPSS